MMVSYSLEFTQTVGQWIVDGEVVAIVALWIALLVARGRLRAFLRWSGTGEYLISRPRIIEWVVRTSGVGIVTELLAALVPALASDRGPLAVYLRDRSRGAVLQRVGAAVLVAIGEELVFRGLPLATAVLLALDQGSTAILVGAGTVVGAFTHGKGNAVSSLLTDDWLRAALWLAGYWPLAVAFASLYAAGTGGGSTLVHFDLYSYEEVMAAIDEGGANDQPAVHN